MNLPSWPVQHLLSRCYGDRPVRPAGGFLSTAFSRRLITFVSFLTWLWAAVCAWPVALVHTAHIYEVVFGKRKDKKMERWLATEVRPGLTRREAFLRAYNKVVSERN